jgi:hypothetical protein
MKKSWLVAIAPFGTLASCGGPPDDAANIPISGKWADQGRMMSFTVGGAAIDPESVPGLGALQYKVNTSSEFCGEPRFLDKEAFQKQIDNNNPAGCVLDDVKTSGNRVYAYGSCRALDIRDVEGSATLKGEARIKPNEVIYDMTFNIVIRDPETGAGEKVVMEARRTMTRLGDC